MSEAQKWVPWALDHLQGWKRLVSIMANVLVFLALAQFMGVDIESLTSGKVVPPVPWWGSFTLAVLAIMAEARLSNYQEERLRKRVAETVPPQKPE